MKMKAYTFIRIQTSLIIALWSGSFGLFGQNEIRTSHDFLNGYELIYGNQNLKIINFETLSSGISLLSRSPKEVSEIKVLLLNNDYLISDSLIVNGWHSADFWSNQNNIYYRPTILYNNDFCELDGRRTRKEIIVKLSVKENEIDQIECLEGHKNQKDKVYEFQDLLLETSNIINRNHHLKIYVDGKLELKKKAKKFDGVKNDPFIIERMNSGFVVLNTVDKNIYLIKNKQNIEVYTFEEDFNLVEFKIQIKYDNEQGLIYVFKIPTAADIDYMTIFQYDFKKFIKLNDQYKKSFYNKVNRGKLYSVFDLKRDDGNFNGIFSAPISSLD